ncbi:MAG: Na+/H+ antiporter NhaC family protein [Myxococcota bacterium]
MPKLKNLFLVLATLIAMAPSSAGAADTALEVRWPAKRLWVGAINVEGIRVAAVGPDGQPIATLKGPVTIRGLKTATTACTLENGVCNVPPATIASSEITLSFGDIHSTADVPVLSGWLTLLPAFLAIALALLTRQVLLSLMGGVLLGAGLLHRSGLAAFPRALDVVVDAAADLDHMKIMFFTMLMGGLVGLITANGGTVGVVQVVANRAKTVRTGSLATWSMGLLIFFDDYASSLIIGTTMRPVTDRLRISREKLSYMVDSTAAPIASLALISTWIGYEVSVLADALKAAGLERDAYEVFLSGLSSRFYQIFALAFVFIIAWLGRDFGPMLTAERRARHEGKVLRDDAEPLMDANLLEDAERMKDCTPRAWLAALPLAVLIVTVLSVLIGTGLEAGAADPAAYANASDRGFIGWLGFILSNAASYDALVYGGGFSAGAALISSVAVGALNLQQGAEAFVRGLQAMLMAIVVLCLAWSIGSVMDDLRAGPYVAQLVGDAVPTWALSTIAFLLAAVMAFATGTSWGTMAILFPIIIPVVAVHEGVAGFENILLGSSSAVLAGAVFGDHCSPISDTTVLSSIASAADLLDHTRTQAPYAILCALVAILVGYIPYGLGVPAPLLIVIGLVLLVAFARIVGERPEDP